MPMQIPNENNELDEHQKKLDAVETQLLSPTPSVIWKGLEQVRQWLDKDPEDVGVYALLLDAVNANPDLREQIHNLLSDMIKSGSKTAKRAMMSFPSDIQELLVDADDFYYATDYDEAIALYRKVLKADPGNTRAQTGLSKVEIRRASGDTKADLPRAATQYYRRARSHIAGRDYKSAIDLLNAAIESAQSHSMNYPDAEIALTEMQNLLAAEKYIEHARLATKQNRQDEAINLYKKALSLDSTNESAKKELYILEQRLKKNLTIRIGIITVVILVVVFFLFDYGVIGISDDHQTVTPTINDLTVEPTIFVTSTSTPSTTPTIPSPTTTNVPTKITPPIVTFTSEPSILGYGKLTAYVYPLESPNGKRLGPQLSPKKPVTVLEVTIDHGDIWYKCQWDAQGVPGIGWIFGRDLQLGPKPSPTPIP